MLRIHEQIDRVVFESDMVRMGAFRCHPDNPSFHDTGPAQNYCFVFPRTSVEIQHEHEPAFISSPNTVNFYNSGQAYQRSAISTEGDLCDWFGVDPEIVREVVRGFDTHVEGRPEQPFRLLHGWSDGPIYLQQRQLFNRITADAAIEPLAV